MTDAPTTWLLRNIHQHSTECSIWLSDENVLRQLPTENSWPNKPAFITNRWDIAEHAKKLGFNTQFSDFDLTTVADNSIDHIFYRISKEKAVTHHLINEAQRILKPQGQLWISGQKNEGIKTYIEKASTLFGCEKNIQKDGVCYSSKLTKNTNSGSLLVDEDYANLRETIYLDGKTLFSKPGQFGWNKIDQGSEFLITEITPLLSPQSFNHCLDLGCGYGYLSIASLHLPILKRTLTDNNAAALATAKANCQLLNIAAEIIASDAGGELKNQFDLILCNPPFHQGFSVDEDLTDKFLRNATKLLTPNGIAYFVVNQFIALEKKALPYFKQVNLIAQNKSFKVVELRKN
ncbi:ribosomal RNA small subunit methyltransferase C [Cellvibrio zantedeschiae]|uniref:Ribosomal RNA small subunit methyltransferase C n=1 Tax=Cellvibrio zantedeschiae TaxID=1237077 RepID=A0ABQ3AYW4_9GAMM|nr:methyltransferase [Cellvibrio zantedeschiae]GGY71123.1 ribosomal RNA small subunit methyltransferase C [Cellvibrio zantedeschiae]